MRHVLSGDGGGIGLVESRSRIMRSIRKTDTRPELVVRRLAHALGFRFRLHRRDLPGSPDIVFPRLRKVIFVHGCFWHQHRDCRLGKGPPQVRQDYWLPKLKRNQERDQESLAHLSRLGWSVLTVWECETDDQVTLNSRLKSFLRSDCG